MFTKMLIFFMYTDQAIIPQFVNNFVQCSELIFPCTGKQICSQHVNRIKLCLKQFEPRENELKLLSCDWPVLILHTN